MTDHSHDGGTQPVPVHVTSIDAQVQLGQAPAAAPPRPRIGCRPYTVVLTSNNPVLPILDWDDKRVYALVQAGGNDAVISNNKSEAYSAANQVATLPSPIGMVLPYGNTAPTKIPGGEQWWAAAAAYPTQITVLVVQED